MNILIIGLGSIARKHIDAIRALENDVKIYAFRSNKNATIEDKIENIFSLEHFIVPLDFVIISNPTNLHFKYINYFAEKGIPLFIEKPVLHSLENSDKLLKLIESKKVITYVACNLRFHPCINYIKQFLISKQIRINEVNVYCGSYLPDWRQGKNFRAFYSANASMGGGVHLDLFHELDYVTWLFGFPLKSQSLLRSRSSLNIDSIDYANFQLEFDTFTANIILNYYRKDSKRNIEIIFEDDTWNIDLLKNIITNNKGSIIYENSDITISNTYYNQMNYFLNQIKSNKKLMNSFQESLKVLKICLLHV